MDEELKPVEWVGDSRKKLVAMPREVMAEIGFQLHQAQTGEMPDLAKPLKGVGSGVFEIKKRFDGDTYRAVYAVQIGDSVYVLHCFQKKAKKGIATPKPDIDLIKKRYKEALEMEKDKTDGDKKKNKKRH